MDKLQDGLFQASRTRTKANIDIRDIDLSSGLTNYRVDVPGSLVYFDRVTTGYASVALQAEGYALNPLTFVSGDSLECPFSSLLLNAPAQSGKTLRLVIGIGISIRGGTGLSTGSSGVATAVTNTPTGVSYTGSYKSVTNVAANTADQVFSAASNTGGAIVWTAEFGSSAASAQTAGFVAKATAPTTVIDGDVIVLSGGLAGSLAFGKLAAPVKIAAGKGLYYIGTLAENGAGNFRSSLYTLL